MLPFIVLNGVSSKLIHGLIVQSLPPITKPSMRVEKEEIDGRDGDIITTLGYEAYDKPITIGLKGDYSIDDVIEYFNSSGEVIFSNEPDRYYKYMIYDQIDFNRLVRFKTAAVNLHVQPFKYSTVDLPIEWVNETQTTIATISVRNTGNIYSKPILTLKGSGIITVYLDNTQVLSIDMGSTSNTIIIDVTEMNATNPAGDFLNRRVTGDYNNLVFKAGNNNLRVTGNIEEITIDKYSRWI